IHEIPRKGAGPCHSSGTLIMCEGPTPVKRISFIFFVFVRVFSWFLLLSVWARTFQSASCQGGWRMAASVAYLMKKALRWTIIAVARGALAGLAVSSVVIVDETEFAVVTSFGRIAAIYGVGNAEAGLHPKAPWQVAIKIDRRFRVFDPPPREVMTG